MTEDQGGVTLGTSQSRARLCPAVPSRRPANRFALSASKVARASPTANEPTIAAKASGMRGSEFACCALLVSVTGIWSRFLAAAAACRFTAAALAGEMRPAARHDHWLATAA